MASRMTTKTSRTKPVSPTANALEIAAAEGARIALRTALVACEWNLTRTARVLGLTQSIEVKRWIIRCGLVEDYEAARADGRVRAGNPAGRTAK